MKFNFDQPHPLFVERMKAVQIAKVQFELAEAELSVVCAHKFAHSTSFAECSVCGACDRYSREDYEKIAISLRKKLEKLTVQDPLIRGGKDDL